MTENEVSQHILALERGALDRWCKGDPDGFLEISAPDVVYFDPFLPQRIDGLPALQKYYAQLRGKVLADGYELVAPEVQVHDEIALLTFRFVSHGKDLEMRWNTTEVYRHCAQGWRIIHSHWSLTQPFQASPQA